VIFVNYRDLQKLNYVTHFIHGGPPKIGIIANFLLILTVNSFENRLLLDKVKAFRKKCANFGGHPVYDYAIVKHALSVTVAS